MLKCGLIEDLDSTWVFLHHSTMIENCQLLVAGLDPGIAETLCPHDDHSATPAPKALVINKTFKSVKEKLIHEVEHP